jgi:hypothetical protein
MNSPQVIEKSIFWQEYILKASTNPKQRERAQRAIDKLKQELERAKS